jgi:signal transduction histidine kinase
MKLFKSFKFRIAGYYLLVTFSLMSVIGGATFLLLSRSLYNNLDSYLVNRYEEVRTALLVGSNHIAIVEQINELILIYDTSGNLIQRIGPNISLNGVNDIISKTVNNSGSKVLENVDSSGGQRLRVYATQVDFGQHLVVIVARPLSEIDFPLGIFVGSMAGTGLLLLLISGIGGWILADRSLKPVEQMTRTAREITAAGLNRRIRVTGEDEISELASTLNDMIERLEQSFIRQKRFTSDASHELRTPLAIIEAETSLALSKERDSGEYRKSLEVVSQETSYMSLLIDKLLYLARSEANQDTLSITEVDLGDLFKEVFSSVSVIAAQRGLTFKLGNVENMLVMADATKLKQVFFSILENAVIYTPSGGSVSGSVQSVEQKAVAVIKDTGIGIPAEDLPHIFERFYRVDEARSRSGGGMGLGLAIAKQALESQGGTIDVESRVKEGTTFTLTLPLKRSDVSANPE